jgi:hypothetical protein
MSGPGRGRLWPRAKPCGRILFTILEIVVTYRMYDASRVCDRSLKPSSRRSPGAVTRPAASVALILPGANCLFAGDLPSLREGDRNLFSPHSGKRDVASLPSSSVQFTKRRIRTFITIPNAKNMNRTEDPP